MKKRLGFIILIYIGVAVFTYALTLRVDRLENQEDYMHKGEIAIFHLK